MAEVDILGPSERRRIWNAEEKAALLAEVDADGSKVRLGARRRGVSESLIYIWRLARKAAAVPLSRRTRPRMFSSFRSACSEARRRADPRCWRSPSQLLCRNLRQRKAKAGRLRSLCRTVPASAWLLFVNEKALSGVLRAMKGLA